MLSLKLKSQIKKFLKSHAYRSRGVRQVSHTVFQSCDLKAHYLEQWADNVRGGRVNVPLEIGGRYYFIDSVVGGCLAGRKLSVSIN